MNKIKIIIFILVFILIINCISFAHPGRTDSNGGHYDRSTGEYHYHNGKDTEKIGQYSLIPEGSSLEIELQKDITNLSSENKKLEERIYELEEKNKEYKDDLEMSGYDSITVLAEELKKREREVHNLWSLFLFVFIIGIAISYSIGTSKKSKQ